MKYINVPKVIEAIELERKFFKLALEFIDPLIIGDYNSGEFSEDSCYIEIKTLEGVMTASEGDFIIKGISGEFYPCKPDIFHKSYRKFNVEMP